MVAFAVVILFLSALFNVVAWPRFHRRIAADPRATDADGGRTVFYRVHVILIAIAVVLAVLSVVAAIGLIATGA